MKNSCVYGKSKYCGSKNLPTESCRTTNNSLKAVAAVLQAAFADINIDKSWSVY
jgi:hypothetical protein